MNLGKWVQIKASNAPRPRCRKGAARARPFIVFACVVLFAISAWSQSAGYENRRISDVVVAFEGADKDITASDEFRRLAIEELGDSYSAVKVRNAIDRLYKTREIATVAVEAENTPADGVRVRFLIKRKTQAKRVSIKIVPEDEKHVTEQELLLKLNLLDPGTAVTDQTLKNNADLILEYLRDRGYFKAEVTYALTKLQGANEVGVTFTVTPNAQATVENFKIAVEGFDTALLQKNLKLERGEPFSRELLAADVERIKDTLSS